MLWLLLPLLFRKYSEETVNAGNTRKAQAKSQPIFKLKSLKLSYKDDDPDYAATSFRDFKWLQRQKKARAKSELAGLSLS